MLAATTPSPVPFLALLLLGFFVGAVGHLYGSKTLVAVGIGMIFLGTSLLPLLVYFSGS